MVKIVLRYLLIVTSRSYPFSKLREVRFPCLILLLTFFFLGFFAYLFSTRSIASLIYTDWGTLVFVESFLSFSNCSISKYRHHNFFLLKANHLRFSFSIMDYTYHCWRYFSSKYFTYVWYETVEKVQIYIFMNFKDSQIK